MTMEEKKFLIQFKDNRFLKSFTTDNKGEVDDITTTIHQDKAMHLNMEDAVVYKRDTFKMFKPEIVEYGTLILHIPSYEDYKLMWERKLQNSTDDELFDEVHSRLCSDNVTVAEIRARLGFCFGSRVDIHYTNKEKEEDIEEVFMNLKYGHKSYINKLTQYQWQCNESIEKIELGCRNGRLWIHSREVIDFRYNSALEMLTDKKVKFPTTGYKEGFVCEKVFFGNTHDYMIKQDGKTTIKYRKDSDYIKYQK